MKTLSATDTLIPAPEDGKDGQDGAPGKDGQDGAPGNDGADGPIPYPCGSYGSTVSYTRTAYMAPVVEYGSLFYLQLKVGTITGINPKTDVANNGGNWAVFDMFKYIMSEVAFIDFGMLASAIFYGKYMFSQYGINASGGAVETEGGYKDFNYSDPMNESNTFRPNILIDFLSGKAWFNDVVAKGEIYATRGIFSGYIRNNIVSIEESDAEPVDSIYSEYYTAYKLKDNLYVDATFNEVVLPCDDDYSGARVMIIDSYFYKSRSVTNPTIIRAESGVICCGSLETSNSNNLVSAIQIDSGAVELIYQHVDNNGTKENRWFVLSHSAGTFKIYS